MFALAILIIPLKPISLKKERRQKEALNKNRTKEGPKKANKTSGNPLCNITVACVKSFWKHSIKKPVNLHLSITDY